jgi:hypothetical protein
MTSDEMIAEILAQVTSINERMAVIAPLPVEVPDPQPAEE